MTWERQTYAIEAVVLFPPIVVAARALYTNRGHQTNESQSSLWNATYNLLEMRLAEESVVDLNSSCGHFESQDTQDFK